MESKEGMEETSTAYVRSSSYILFNGVFGSAIRIV